MINNMVIYYQVSQNYKPFILLLLLLYINVDISLDNCSTLVYLFQNANFLDYLKNLSLNFFSS